MKKYYLIFIVFVFLSCGYRILKNNEGEPLIDPKKYTFTKMLTPEDTRTIDTSFAYLQTFDMENSNEQERSNPKIYIFHNDGYFQISSVKFYTKFNGRRSKNSIYYGGKFYVEGNEIFLEAFYPFTDGSTNHYNKVISKGIVKNDTLHLTIFKNKTTYIKKRLQDIIK